MQELLEERFLVTAGFFNVFAVVELLFQGFRRVYRQVFLIVLEDVHEELEECLSYILHVVMCQSLLLFLLFVLQYVFQDALQFLPVVGRKVWQVILLLLRFELHCRVLKSFKGLLFRYYLYNTVFTSLSILYQCPNPLCK